MNGVYYHGEVNAPSKGGAAGTVIVKNLLRDLARRSATAISDQHHKGIIRACISCDPFKAQAESHCVRMNRVDVTLKLDLVTTPEH